jgi:hypothetical protein
MKQPELKLWIKIGLLLLLLPTINLAQPSYTIKGWVYDAKTRDPLPYTNLILVSSRTGTITNHEGSFEIQTNLLPDTLNVSAIGYHPFSMYLSAKNHQNLQFALAPKNFELDEVVIRPGENPAIRIIRNAIEKRDKNNPMKVYNYACNTYTKILVNAINDKENVEQTEKLQKTGIPIYFSEKVSQNIYQRNPFIQKGKIVAQKQEGLGFLSDLNVLGYDNNMSIEVNLYDNAIELFDKPFMGPLNNRALLFYKFSLTDSLITDFGKEYLIEYKPKNERDIAFTGHMKITDETWTITEVFAKLPQTANLNYVNKLEMRQTFVPINDSLTFFKTNETTAELKLAKDKSPINIDFTAKLHKKSVYSDVMLNFPSVILGDEESIWSLISPIKKQVRQKDLVESLRPEELTLKETSALRTIDSLNRNWKIRTADVLTRMFVTGYIPGRYIELGPYLELIKNNKVEGMRYTFAARTSPSMTKNVMLYGHAGYGTRDKDWKYGGGLQYKFNTENRRILSLEFRDDLSKIGDNRSIFLIKENMMVTGEDNVIAAIFTNKPLDKLSREVRYNIGYENEWKRGVTTYTNLTHKDIFTGIYMPFIQNGQPIDNFQANEATLGLRLSWEENYTDHYCRRFYMVTPYPILHLRATAGQYQINKERSPYLTLRGVINHDLNWGQTKVEYLCETGITFGTVPFPLLEIHRTDLSLGYAIYSFNMMNEMEFAADRFVNVFAQHHLNGLLFNRVPLLKRLGIREVYTAKLLWSHLDTKHQQILSYPKALYDARYLPYTELSVGAENIFQYLRFDFIWRVFYRDHTGVSPTGVRVRFDVNF